MDFLTPTIAGGSSLLGNIVNAAYGANQSALEYSRNRRMQERQYEMQQEMWNKSNEYNTPSAVLQRMRDAGINPNAFLSDGSSVAPASPMSGASASVGNGAIQGINFNPISDALNAALMKENINSAEISNAYKAEEIRASIDKAVADARLSHQEAVNIQFEMDKWTDTLKGKTEAEIKAIYASMNETAARIREINQHTDNLSVEKRTHVFENVINEAKANLAQQGIIIDAPGLGSLVSALMSDKIGTILSTALSNLVGGLVEGSVRGVGNIIQRVLDFGRSHRNNRR